MKRFVRFIAGALCAGIVFGNSFFGEMSTVNAANIPINASTFPDAYFRNYVLNNFDGKGGSAKDQLLSDYEIKNATSIYLNGSQVTSIQ
ncbi:MAG: hypothetical protein MJ172_05215 [Clostridia bacterium]|nr:hypothetical protein [Clostridia bacterium]